MITKIKSFEDMSRIKPGDKLLWVYARHESEMSMIDALSQQRIRWIYLLELIRETVRGNEPEFGYGRMEFHLTKPFRPEFIDEIGSQNIGYNMDVNFPVFAISRFETMEELLSLLPVYVVIHNYDLIVRFWKEAEVEI